MAKYLNETGLSYFWGKLKAYFVAQEAGKGLSTNDFTDVLKTKLEGVETGAQVNILEGVQVNGTDLTITDKKVNVDLSNYATKADIASVYKFKGSVSTYGDLPSTGQVVGDTYNVETADSTHGIKAGDNVAWDGKKWDILAGTVDLSAYATTEAMNTALAGKVDKVTGKGLSTNDFTNADKTKLNGIAEGAEVNVQADWNETDTTSDAYIQNKPNIPSELIVITNAEIDTIVAN
jgi:Cu/Ag efflux protein CusF